jgi:hypothetical protein
MNARPYTTRKRRLLRCSDTSHNNSYVKWAAVIAAAFKHLRVFLCAFRCINGASRIKISARFANYRGGFRPIRARFLANALLRVAELVSGRGFHREVLT